MEKKTYRESLLNNREAILFSKSMATIDTNVPVALDVDAMRAGGVLIGRTGPRDDVLKIRPPLVFGEEHAAVLVGALHEALGESKRSAA